jgi:hypothetical protein
MRGRLLRTGLAVAAFSMMMAVPAAAHGGNSDESTNLTSLPVGETVDEPTVGGLWSCQTYNANAAGAQTEGPWFNGDGTWDATEKYTVDGEVDWPQAEYSITKEDGQRIISTNNLPDHTTGEFPVSEDDDAYSVDRNPNTITEQDYTFEIDATPEIADEPSCVGGIVGVLKSGVLLFNSTDAGGRDAVAYEVQDECDGHPNPSGYHYHSVSDCVLEDLDTADEDEHSKLVGYALDGFGIYGNQGEDGEELTAADLDECHGHTHEVKFNGEVQEIYHYHATVDYPYTVGCFKGTATSDRFAGGGGPAGQQGGSQDGEQNGAPTGQGPGNMPPPPPGADGPPNRQQSTG